jgi:hypothetical protein
MFSAALLPSEGHQHFAIANFCCLAILLVSLAIATACGAASANDSNTLTNTPVLPPVLFITTQNLPSATVGSPYSGSLTATGGVPPYSWAISSGTIPNGFSLGPNTGLLSGTATQTGAFAFQATVADSQGVSAPASLSIVVQANSPPPLSITTQTLPSATVGSLYSGPLAATGGVPPYSWTISSGTLPDGFSFGPNTGVLSGTTTQIGTFAFQATVTDSQTHESTASLSILVVGNTPPPLSITTQTLPSATTGSTYSSPLAASGGVPPYSWAISSGSLPDGFSLGPNTGVLSGTTAQIGTFAFQATVTDSQTHESTASLSILVLGNTPPPLSITTQTLPSATTGSPYSGALAAAGGVPPYSWEISAGALPDGFGLDHDTGLLSGTTTQTGTFAFQPTVTDSQGSEADASLSILVVGAPSTTVDLPQNWVNSLEWRGTTSNTIKFPASGTGGSWTCGLTNYGPYTANSQSSAEQALEDAESCRTANGSGTTIVIPANAVFSGSGGIPLPQTTGDNATSFIVLQSSTPLPYNQTVCAHGTQDNNAEAVYPGLTNPGCNGSNLSYQNGTSTVTSIPPGAFTLANGTATNTSAYNDVAGMWGIQYSGTTQGITCGVGSDGSPCHHYVVIDAHVFPTPCTFSAGPPPTCTGGNANPTSAIKISPTSPTSATSVSQLADHIHFLGVYVSTDWTDATSLGYPVGSNEMTNAFDIESCTYCSIMYSYTDHILSPGQESHQIQGGYTLTAKWAHNWFEGASIGAFCGGYGSSLSDFAMLCTDVEDRGNRYTYAYSWMTAYQNGFLPNNGSQGYVRKNASELKTALRYLRDGNIYENVDDSGAQNGTAFTAKVAQCNGGLTCNNYFLSTTNITMTNLIYRRTCNGPSLGDPGELIDGGGVSLGVQNVLFQNNLGYNIGSFIQGHCSGTAPTYAIRVGPGEQSWSCAASSGTVSAGLTPITLVCTSETGGEQLDMVNGDPVVTAECSDSTFDTPTTSIGPSAYGTSPTSLTLSYNLAGATASESGVSCTFVTGTGKPYYVSLLHNTFVAQEANSSPAVCIYDSYSTKTSGIPFPQPFYFMKNQTIQNNLCATFGDESTQSQGLFDETGEGTRPEITSRDRNTFNFNYDVFASSSLHGTVDCLGTTCTLVSGDAPNAQGARMRDGLVLINGTAYGPPTAVSATSFTLPAGSNPGTATGATYLWADYTEYGGANTGDQPPVTVSFPAAVNCSTDDPTVLADTGVPACVGMVGAMSTSFFPDDLGDWNQYRLCHLGDSACNNSASFYAAGNVHQAADGTDLGFDPTMTNAAETSTLYQCRTSCGSTGPYPDD